MENNNANQGTLVPVLYNFCRDHATYLLSQAFGFVNMMQLFRYLTFWVNSFTLKDYFHTVLIEKVFYLKTIFISIWMFIFSYTYTQILQYIPLDDMLAPINYQILPYQTALDNDSIDYRLLDDVSVDNVFFKNVINGRMNFEEIGKDALILRENWDIEKQERDNIRVKDGMDAPDHASFPFQCKVCNQLVAMKHFCESHQRCNQGRYCFCSCEKKSEKKKKEEIETDQVFLVGINKLHMCILHLLNCYNILIGLCGKGVQAEFIFPVSLFPLFLCTI